MSSILLRVSTRTSLAFSILGASALHAQWPQFGGPRRDFHAPAGELATVWPDVGPPVSWRRLLGDGYSEVVVDGERLFTLYRRDRNEVVVALERDTGDTLWEHAYEVVTTRSAQEFGDGPSSTPVLADGRLVTIGIGMDVHCFDPASGEVLWSHDLMEEFEIPMPGRGYSPSPLVHDGLVILAIGGTDPCDAVNDAPILGIPDGAVLALDLEDGEIVWGSCNFPGAKASPLLVEIGGRAQLVVFMGNELAGLDPTTGELLWRHPHPTDYGFNCSTPAFDGVDTLFCSSAYGKGAEAVQIVATATGFEPRRKWSTRRLSVHFTNIVLLDGMLFGVNGMGRPGLLTCIDAETGDMLWNSREFARGNLVYAGGPFVILDEDGDLALVTLTHEGLEIHGRLTVADSHVFTAPTLVGSELYVRDRSHLTRFDLSPEAVARLAAGEGRAFALAGSATGHAAEALTGTFELVTDADAVETLVVRVEHGWLVIDFGEGDVARLARSSNQGWELVEDRTSGSSPRTVEFSRDDDGAVRGLVLRGSRAEALEYRVVG